MENVKVTSLKYILESKDVPEVNDVQSEEETDEYPNIETIQKREKEMFVRYLRESPELWKRFMDELSYNLNGKK